jgi:vitamin B12 transporter
MGGMWGARGRLARGECWGSTGLMHALPRSIALLPILFAAPVAAQVEGAQDIIVTGAGLRSDAGEAAYAVDRVTPLDDARPALRLEQLIAALPGAQAFRRADTRSSHPTANGLTTRALGGNAASRTLVLLDGVPMADPFGGWVTWNRVDSASLRGVTLQRGGVIGAGPGALAGVLNLDSIVSDSVSGAVSYAGRDSRSVSLLAGGQLGGASVTASLRHDAGDGFTPIIARQRGAADGAAPYDSGSARVRAIIPAGSGEVQASIGGHYDDRNRGLAFTDNRSAGAGASVRYVRQVSADDWGVEALAFAQTVAFDSGFAGVDAARAAASPTLNQRVSATGWGARVTVQPYFMGALSLRFGGHIGGQDGVTREGFTFVNGTDGFAPSRDRRAGGRNGQMGLFGGGDVALSPAATVNFGIGGDWLRQSKGQLTERVIATGGVLQDGRPTARTRFAATGRAGLSVRPSAAVTVRAAAYTQVRQATLNELYRPFRVGLDGVAANPSLVPERLWGAEIGADWRVGSAFSASLTGYIARLDHAIANVAVVRSGTDCPGVGFVRGTCFARQNLPAIESVGVEGSARLVLGPVTANAALAYGDARVKGGVLNGFTPAQTPKWSGSARVQVAFAPALSIHGGAIWQSARFEDDRESVRLPGFVAFDVGAEWRVSRRMSIAVDAENLTNESIVTGNSGGVLERAAPRIFWFTVRIR